MIDNLPAPLPLPGASSVSNTPPAAGSGTAADTGNTTSEESFASTLQSRLQQTAINKPPGKAPPREIKPDSKQTNPATDIDALLALNADKASGPTNPVALAALAAHENGENTADAVLAAVAAKLTAKDKTKQDTTADTPTTPSDASASPIVPTALNAIAVTPSTTTGTMTSREDEKTAGNSSPASTQQLSGHDTPAILAADGDKNAPAPANPDKPKEGDFADLLKNNAPIAGTNAGAHAVHVANTGAPVTREVRTPVSSPQWSNDVGNQVSWMVNQRQSQADLVLNPPQLGRIEVSITLNGDQATANFVSPNADVRDALQGSLPRLREILADAGVFLGQANIGAESFQQNGNGAEKGKNSYGESISSVSETLLGSSGRSVSQGPIGVMRGQGLIDLFA